MSDETGNDNDPESVLGTVHLKLSGKVRTDTWDDYETTWGLSEKRTIDIVSVSHFGWCVGVEFASLAVHLIEERMPRSDEAMRGLAESLENAADEILKALQQNKDL